MLLDTHIDLWFIPGDQKLKSYAQQILAPADAIDISSTTRWEISMKVRLGNLIADSTELMDTLESSRWHELTMSSSHAARVPSLPLLHRDPFDRIHIAPAIAENLYFLSADSQLAQSSDAIIQV